MNLFSRLLAFLYSPHGVGEREETISEPFSTDHCPSPQFYTSTKRGQGGVLSTRRKNSPSFFHLYHPSPHYDEETLGIGAMTIGDEWRVINDAS